MNNVGDTINALKRFKQAYYGLLVAWRSSDVKLNNTKAISYYPFMDSLDEVGIPEWVDKTVEELTPRASKDDTDIGLKTVRDMLKVIYEKQDDIGCMSVKDIQELRRNLEILEYVKMVKDFHKYTIDSMPNCPEQPGETNEEHMAIEKAYDEAMDKFYRTKWTIGFGDRMITLENEATIYNYITDLLEELIEYCL